MTLSNWDVIVLGLGGVGSSAVRHLAARGCRVLGIDQYSPAHVFGSSHGQSRVIRQAYFEHPSYVPLLRRAYDLWDQLSEASDRPLFERTGLIEIGPTDGVVVPGVLASAREYELPIEKLSLSEVSNRWPGISGDEDSVAVLEKNAGFLRVENCVAAQLDLAQQQGAECLFETKAESLSIQPGVASVTTRGGNHQAKRLVIAGGAWSPQLLGIRELDLKILRKHQYWFEPNGESCKLSEGCPCFFHETKAGYFYGFPDIDSRGVKLARHSGGEELAIPDGSETRASLDESDLSLVREYARGCLPGVGSDLREHAGCYYTVTRDEHFVLDRHPHHDEVVIVAGLSGHGFKFTSVLGEIAADLAMGDETSQDISLFQANRLLESK